jgi:hypothetical protein
LLREHRRLYGKPPLAKWRWPFGIVSGTAAAALLLVFAGQFLQGEPPLHQAELDNGGNGLVWEQTGKPPVSEDEGPVTGIRNHPEAADLTASDETEREGAPASDSGNPADARPADRALLAQDDAAGGSGSGHEKTVASADDGGVSQNGNEDGQAVAMGPAKGQSGSDAEPQAPAGSTADAGPDEGKPVREFVFSSSYITMSNVVPFRADTLPANVELNVDESALPAEKPVYAFAEQMPLDLQQRQAAAQALGLGDDEQVTTKGFRYRGADGSTLLFSTEGLPTMEYVYRGALSGSDGVGPGAVALENGGNDALWVERAKAFLKQIRVDVAGMTAQVQAPFEGDKWTVTFIPELAGAPNLAGAVTVHMKQGAVVEAKVPLLAHVKAKRGSTPLVPLPDVLRLFGRVSDPPR